MAPKSWRQLKKNDVIPATPSASDGTLAEGSTTTIVPEDFQPGESACKSFIDTVVQFGSACVDVWPEDSKIKNLLETVHVKKSDETFVTFLTKEFHSTYKDLYSDFNKKDLSVFEKDKPFFTELCIGEKMKNATPEVRETVFEYIRLMVQWSTMHSMYSKCPSNMMNTIASAAKNFTSKLETGDLDFSKLNPMTLGQELMSTMKPEDLDSFTKSLMEDGGDNIRSMMTGMVNSLSENGNLNLPGGDAMAEMLKQMLNSAQAPSDLD